MPVPFRLSRLVALAALAGTAAACASTPPPVPPTVVRGLYIYQDGAQTLRPCGSTATFWVVGDEEVLEPVRTRSAARAKALGQPHQGIYAEITGGLEPSETPGYENMLRAVEASHLDDHLPATCTVTPPAG
jgi:hypothetical protein